MSSEKRGGLTIAIVNNQALGSRRAALAWCHSNLEDLIPVPEKGREREEVRVSSTRFEVCVERVAEIELTVGCDSSDSKSPILIVQPSSVRRSVGQEEVKMRCQYCRG